MKPALRLLVPALTIIACHVFGDPSDRWWPDCVEAALVQSGDNRDELAKALIAAPEAQREGLKFLVENMPDPDLRRLSSTYLLENTALAFDTMAAVPWSKQVPRDIFLENVLPYASLNERRDDWRKRLREIAAPIVRDCQTPGEAAQALNRKLFDIVKVRYSTDRKKPDQSALESMESGIATCSGLSILLVDACRAAGIPARIAGTPMWKNMRGNHTWVEVWDGGWHFVGAAEPDPKGLDHGWFNDGAAEAERDVPEHAIYASSFRKTGLAFPLVWAPAIRWVPAINVTDRYTGNVSLADAASAGTVRLVVSVLKGEPGKRVIAKVILSDPSDGTMRLEGASRGETADLNDFLTFSVSRGHRYTLRIVYFGRTVDRDVITIDGSEIEQAVSIAVGD